MREPCAPIVRCQMVEAVARPGRVVPWLRLVPGTSELSGWLLPFVVARLVASLVAVALVCWHGLRASDVPMLLYGPASTAALAMLPGLRREPATWLLDICVGLGLILRWGDWHSPYYLLWLTTLVLPAASLPLRRALWLGTIPPLAFLAVALFGGPSPGRLAPVSSETLAIHVLLPYLLTCSLAYAADALRRLDAERAGRERRAIEAERQRIAWELHDSAKQRLHAAHFLVSSLQGRIAAPLDQTVERAVEEIESAASDMDTSLAELRSPLEGRRLDVALRERVEEIAASTPAAITVAGHSPELPPLVAAHVYRIGCEALTNALRHSDAANIELVLGALGHTMRLEVRDDGHGMPAVLRPGASGLSAMRSRATAVGAKLNVAPRAGGGTVVVLDLPLNGNGGLG